MNGSGSWDRKEHVRQSRYIDAEVISKLSSLVIPQLQGSERLRLACGSFGNAIHHSRAITLLVESGHDGSALALGRSCLEAYIVGLWLRYCANEAEIRQIGEGERPPPKINKMLALITKEGFPSKLKWIVGLTWSTWSMHTLGGWGQIQGQLSAEGLEQNYPPEWIALTLMWADHWYLYSAAEIAAAADNKCLQHHFLSRSIAYQQLGVVMSSLEKFGPVSI